MAFQSGFDPFAAYRAQTRQIPLFPPGLGWPTDAMLYTAHAVLPPLPPCSPRLVVCSICEVYFPSTTSLICHRCERDLSFPSLRDASVMPADSKARIAKMRERRQEELIALAHKNRNGKKG
jgi:hypothetical protein